MDPRSYIAHLSSLSPVQQTLANWGGTECFEHDFEYFRCLYDLLSTVFPEEEPPAVVQALLLWLDNCANDEVADYAAVVEARPDQVFVYADQVPDGFIE